MANMFIRKSQDNLTWQDMYKLLNEANADDSEEEVSKWSKERPTNLRKTTSKTNFERTN